jgi:hypothetical protein
MSATTFSQQSKADYLKRSRNQKKAGWILLSAGSATVITSIIFPKGGLIADYSPAKYSFENLKTTLFIIGGSLNLSSVPFFIYSGKNKRKAAAVSFKMENYRQPYKLGYANTSFPAIIVRFKL